MKKRPAAAAAIGNRARQKNATHALETKVNARQRLIERLLAELRSLLMKKGKNVPTRKSRWHVRSKWQLDSVPGLLIKGDFEQTLIGGNDLRIWHSSRNAKLGTSATLVFSIYWQDISACLVSAFKEDTAWLTAVDSAIYRAINDKGKCSRPRRAGTLRTISVAAQQKLDRMKRRMLMTRALQLKVA